MKSRPSLLLWLAVGLQSSLVPILFAAEPPPPVIETISVSNSVKNIRFQMYPGASNYTIYSGANPAALAPNPNFVLAPYITGYTSITNNTNNVQYIITVTNYAYEWRATNFNSPQGFFRVGVTPGNSNAILASTVLNRLAYGPTPDELERVMSIGPQAYINEQLNMDGIPDSLDTYAGTVEVTNSIASDPTTNWLSISFTGTVAQTTFYLFSTAPADVYVDDIDLRPYRYFQNITTNIVNGTNIVYVTNKVVSHICPTNILVNGDFESGFGPWTSLGGAAGSVVDNTRAHSGANSLHFISSTTATAPGNNYVRQVFAGSYLTTNTWGDSVSLNTASSDQVILTYWYQPSATSTKLRLQLGSGINSTPGGLPPTPKWVYATATGIANSTPQLYMYLSAAGECYIDDVKLVAGTNAGVGVNLLPNGDFESGTSSWLRTGNHATSDVSSTIAHSGNGSVHVIATGGGGSTGNSVYQTAIAGLLNNQIYTVSYWYLPKSPGANLTVRLSGSFLNSTPDTVLPGLARRLDDGDAGLSDLRAWFCTHAVQSPRQLFEVLSQFWENHFVTQYSKSQSYFTDTHGYDGTIAGILAADWEYQEMTKWRNAMLNPNCTFYDLLKIHVESPAEIVYLDSVNSKGNGNNIANENYARELLELFTMGVDNGYDQNDIVLMSRAWTGWSVELVDPVNANNPFAPASVTYYPGTNSTGKPNTIGTWAFNFKSGSHGTNRGAIFGGKTVPARFGPPWAGTPYQIALPARGQVTNAIQDGYDVIVKLAESPFTAEFISVKLCRLFVHDDFPNPTTISELPEYAFYDYTNPDRSEEAELVHQCMLAWENSTPKGNIRAVLSTIFNSELFRTHGAAAQKVKTPFEFVASSIRALRGNSTTNTPTAFTDGYAFATRLDNMGSMRLFDRDAPDGYPEVASPWISSGTLVERIRFIQALLTAGTGDDAGNQTCDPAALVAKKLPGNVNNAAAVADYFLGILFPGEGKGNLTLHRNAAINYLNTDDNGASSPFASQSGTTYDTRVRGMVSMLMAYPRFQEQ